MIKSKSILWASALLVGLSPLTTVTDLKAQENGDQQNESENGKKPEFPPYTKVMEGYQEVISRGSDEPSLMSIWTREKDGQMLAALSAKKMKSKYYIALTVASGEDYAGLQAGEIYGYWKKIDDRLAFIVPNLEIRANGEKESRMSVERLFTDRVLFDVPILTMLPKWGPVIDMDALLVGKASLFFGSSVSNINPRLAVIKTAEAFPGNVELSYEVPVGNGQLKTIHYSISTIPENTGYKPRRADERVGYFTTHYSDYGSYSAEENTIRYVNRWHLEKADPKLAVSPVKEPIIFYIEHTTPVRYRRWVREGVLMWNKAFEKVGLADAIEVRYQDATTGAHMEKHPEDVRYNFVRWLNNNVGTAIGPSRVDPNTGQILDADIILTDGWIRHYWTQYHKVMPQLMTEGFTPETMAWLNENPDWDPRIRLAPPSQRNHLKVLSARMAGAPYGGHEAAQESNGLIGDQEFDGLSGRISQVNGLCRAADWKSMDIAMMRFLNTLRNDAEEDEDKDGDGDDKKEDDNKDKKPEETLLDGVPESFIGPLIAELVAHEVGHTLGLRHNFKASSIYSQEEINSEEIKGKKPFAGSVMDYLPINMKVDREQSYGDHTMIDIGPYDMWAIEYGYSTSTKQDDLDKILSRVAEPELAFATDEDTFGPDPFARRYDFAKDPLEYAKNQINLANYHRDRILTKFVKDGESWSKARRGYEMTLSFQSRSLSMMGNWIGGAFVYRDKKGDPNGRKPIEVVPGDEQRDALEFVIDNAFNDEAFGLTPELLRHMSLDKWWDDQSSVMADSTWPVHDRIEGIQSSVLTMIFNPSTLGRVYDNELIADADEDVITLPEVMNKVSDNVWRELDQETEGKEFSSRNPMISSLRRNLQSEYLDRLIQFATKGRMSGPASKSVTALSRLHLRKLDGKIKVTLENKDIDDYTRAHLTDAQAKISKALDALYVM
jgi:hypothetical protein